MASHCSKQSLHFTLTPTRPSDRERVRDFVNSTHVKASALCDASRTQQISDLPNDFPELHSDEAWAALPEPHGWVFEDPGSGAILGAVGIKPGNDIASTVHVSYLFVAPQTRGMGLGRALLRAALRGAADDHRAQSCTLLSLKGVYAPALALYASEGFQETREETTRFYTLVFMELDLAQWAAF